MSEIKLEGEGPFSLRTPQRVSAAALDENVHMTLHVLVQDRVTPVYVEMTEPLASQLATKLIEAATAARANKQRG